MFSVAAWLDEIKEKNGIESDYRLSKLIRKNQTLISNYRAGRSMPDASIVEALCNLSGDDPGLVLAEIEMLRAKDESTRNLWQQVAARLRMVPAAAVAAASLVAVGANAASAHAFGMGYCLHTAGVAGSNPASPTRLKIVMSAALDVITQAVRQLFDQSPATSGHNALSLQWNCALAAP